VSEKKQTIEEILGIGQVVLPELDETLKKFNEDFPVGCQVVLHSLQGNWGVLTSLTGKVWRLTGDPMWSHVIELDYPLFVPAASDAILERNITPDWAIEWSKKYECPIDSSITKKPWNTKVTVHGSALLRMDQLSDGDLSFINYGNGLVPSQEVLEARRFVRMWEWLSEFSSQDLEAKEYEDLAKETWPEDKAP